MLSCMLRTPSEPFVAPQYKRPLKILARNTATVTTKPDQKGKGVHNANNTFHMYNGHGCPVVLGFPLGRELGHKHRVCWVQTCKDTRPILRLLYNRPYSNQEPKLETWDILICQWIFN